jgi:DNA-binding NtrC family response regulator
MRSHGQVLIVDDERELRESLSHTLERLGYDPLLAETGEEALAMVQAEKAPRLRLVLLDVNLPGMTGLEVLKKLRAHDPSVSVLIITAHGNIRDAVEAMREGAFNYIEKPVREQDILAAVQTVREARELAHQMGLQAPRITLESGEEFVGHSQAMRAVFEVIHRLGQVNTSVLIRGENGTGKELVARAIHFNSGRKERPFVAVNCGAIPETLVESEFFGHERGAFTGAEQRHIGKFQAAEGGTLFLDEIGDLPAALQVKLLRVLQERRFTPVGSNRELRCDVRIVAATNQPLEELIRRGAFRQDLFYRLNVMPIHLPPLRDRKEDLSKLIRAFIDKFNHLHGRTPDSEILGVRDDALSALKLHRWPGNVRELENVIERAFVLENGQWITLNSLPEELQPPCPVAHPNPGYQDQKELFEREFILAALRKNQGRINQTVLNAGIPKNTLLRKIRKYGINAQEIEGKKGGEA